MANRPAVMDRLYGSEPVVINAQGIELSKLLNWYNLNSEPEDRRKWILEYAKNRLQYSEEDLSLLQGMALQVVQTVCYCARAIMKGSTFTNQLEIINYIDDSCKKAIEKARVAYNESHQERERVRIGAAIARRKLVSKTYWELFDQLEQGTGDIVLTALNDLTVPEMNRIKAHIDSSLDEYKAAKNDSEGYEHLNLRSMIKRLEVASQGIVRLTSTEKARKKTTVIRKRKPLTASKQVSKLRYAKEVDGFKSVNPEAILTANVLFVYDEKARKLIKFTNPDGQRLTISNSKVTAHTIVCRTLRKPSISLTEMRKGTFKTAERVYESLTTKEQPHTGRMTDKCLILRVNSI